MTTPAIRIDGVNKRFGSTHAVRDLDLIVPSGSICGFLGPNGAGKSTTIRMIMSIIYPDSGSIEVLGSGALANKDRIGYLPEERGVYRKMRVGEFLRYIARLKGVPKAGLKQRIEDWLERVDLPGVQHKRCQELSKGMQQKVQVLVSVINEPELIILDEPFSGLDPVNADLVTRLIRELNDRGRTIIFSTHVLPQAEQICDRFFLINRGRKLLDAPLDEIRERFDPRTILVEPLNGAPPNLDVPGVARTRPRDDAIEIELTSDADPHGVMEAVLRQGPLRSIQRRRLTLEEVFVRLVQSDEGEEAAAAARAALHEM